MITLHYRVSKEAGCGGGLRSLVDTDYPGVEVVIGVDDGSTDDTAGIVERIR